ncbi:hypothetical protein [Levilactobacillus fujinensis]|uniref:Gram-positive cocci surface proteins LPxTG domain-containing protein n=1 Tax=Levilactobacillus fujinensis TaxID=2486024 RepID=A0ABW1TGR8_9LACO|nr:hypothetical protein [Levilactobacillus fujinensis]
MNKTLKQLMLVLTLVLGLGMGTSTLAKAQTTDTGSTSVGITFTGNNSRTSTTTPVTPTVKDGSDGDAINDTIPDGTKVTKTSTPKTGSAADTVTPVSTSTASPRKGGSGVAAVKSTMAALAAGRLPQTGEVQSILADLVGILLLMVLILGLVVYHQARLLRERE